MSKRGAVWLAVLVVVLLLLAAAAAWFLLPSNRSFGRALFGAGTADSSWSREVKYSVDGHGEIVSERTAAILIFEGGKLVVEKALVLLNDQEVAALADDAKLVEIDYTGGRLTVTADGTRIHDAKLRK
jgi:hypothetical protein